MGLERSSCPPPAWRQNCLQTILEGGLTTLFITTSGGLNTDNQGLPGHWCTLQRTICVCLFWLFLLKSPTQGQGQVPNMGSLEQHTEMSKIHLAAKIYWRTHKENILNYLVQILTSPRSWKRRVISQPLSNSSCEWQDRWGFCLPLF